MAIVVFLIPFLIYLKTLAPTVVFGDSGELVAAAYTLGIPHPPGMPIWCVLAHIFTKLPIGNVAWRVNLSSATFASLTCVVVYLIIKKISDYTELESRLHRFSQIGAASAALILAFTRSFWQQATVAEVYSLNFLFVALTLFFLIRWQMTTHPASRNFLNAFAFTYGLSLANHYLMLALAPAYSIWIISIVARRHKDISVREFLFFLLLGLSAYLYLPIRAKAHPAINWGDPSTLKNFLLHIGRRQFGVPLALNRHTVLSAIGAYAKVFSREVPIYISWLGIPGLISLYRKARPIFWLSFLAFLSTGVGYIYLSGQEPNGGGLPIVPSVLIFASWIGCGLRSIPRIFVPMGLAAAILLGISNYSTCDMSRYDYAHRHGIHILDSLPQDALVFSEMNNWLFPVAYLQIVERKRPDLKFIDRQRNLFKDIYNSSEEFYKRDLERKFIASSERPVYYIGAMHLSLGSFGIPMEQEGIVYRAKGPQRRVDFRGSYSDMLLVRDSRDIDLRETLGYYHLLFGESLYREGMRMAARAELRFSSQIAFDNPYLHKTLGMVYDKWGDFQAAIEEYKKSLALRPDSAEAHNNLGVSLAHLGRMDEAQREWRAALELDPNYLPAKQNLILGTKSRITNE